MAGQYTFGEVPWDQADSNTSSGPRIPFLVMKEPATYQVRIVSKPFQYYHHWIQDISGVQKKVNCTADESTCPVCKLGGKDNKAKPHWLFKVIDRKETKEKGKTVIKVLDCGSQILNSIVDYNKDPNWGKVITYDLNIKRGPKGRNPLYTIQALPKTPLTDDEKAAITSAADEKSETYINLEKIGKAWTPEKINNVINGVSQNAAASSSSSSEGNTDGDGFEDVAESTTPSKPKSQPTQPTQAKTTTKTASDEDFLDL